MTKHAPVDLIRLADEENSVVVQVTGPTTEVLPWDGCLDIGIAVASDFAKGNRTEVCLLPEGRPVQWMDGGRNPEIRITPKGPYICHGEVRNAIEVVVRDTPVSLTSVCVLVRLPADWVDIHRVQLGHVRAAWPFGPN
ncbi:DUF5959 family protein [Streptomyces sp. cg40]|uniref:DUF5959 family protein n=1 Tax=Streptomyces sp. cg40 TaxID=3419764 RepID=UPI003D07A3F5